MVVTQLKIVPLPDSINKQQFRDTGQRPLHTFLFLNSLLIRPLFLGLVQVTAVIVSCDYIDNVESRECILQSFRTFLDLAFTCFLALLLHCYLSLRGGDTSDMFRAEHTTFAYSLHLEQNLFIYRDKGEASLIKAGSCFCLWVYA